jgi:predicted nucleic acid-binding protein
VILVDTNVVSAFMTSTPANPVLQWLNDQTASSLYLSAITVAEINNGLQLLPAGKRRDFLHERFEMFVTQAFAERVLDFDQPSANLYGEIAAQRRTAGRPISTLDAQIAAIARYRGFTLATRNTKDFVDCGIELVNPFLG